MGLGEPKYQRSSDDVREIKRLNALTKALEAERDLEMDARTAAEARLEAAESVVEAVKRWSISSVRFHADKELLAALAHYSEVTKEEM